ncbi:hypothetical protein AALO_G00273160, partial [Alosa alosa]
MDHHQPAEQRPHLTASPPITGQDTGYEPPAHQSQGRTLDMSLQPTNHRAGHWTRWQAEYHWSTFISDWTPLDPPPLSADTYTVQIPHDHTHPTTTHTPRPHTPHNYTHPTTTHTPQLHTPHDSHTPHDYTHPTPTHPTTTHTPRLHTPHDYTHPTTTPHNTHTPHT